MLAPIGDLHSFEDIIGRPLLDAVGAFDDRSIRAAGAIVFDLQELTPGLDAKAYREMIVADLNDYPARRDDGAERSLPSGIASAIHDGIERGVIDEPAFWGNLSVTVDAEVWSGLSVLKDLLARAAADEELRRDRNRRLRYVAMQLETGAGGDHASGAPSGWDKAG